MEGDRFQKYSQSLLVAGTTKGTIIAPRAVACALTCFCVAGWPC